MSTLLVTVVIFILVSLISSTNRRGQPPTGRSRIPWFPPENLPNRRLQEPWQDLDPWEQGRNWQEMQPPGSIDVDPNKVQELTEAEGKEGEWGDEGRPDSLNSDALPRKSAALKTAKAPEQLNLAEGGDLLAAGPLNEPGSDIMLTSNQLTQAVIWSEILGRPRAARKYRTSRY